MRLTQQLRHWIADKIRPSHRDDARESRQRYLHRFEGAETTRLNKQHWRATYEQSINADLIQDLPTLRSRLGFEISRNPILEGVVSTFAKDVAGEEGPTFRCISDDAEYNAALQGLWRSWFLNPDIAGKVDGVGMIELWVRRLLDSGEYLAQRVTKKISPGPVSLRLKFLHPRRLRTPPALSGIYDVVMGIKRSDVGEPLEYYISDPLQMFGYELEVGKFTTVLPRDLIHEFVTTEEDQARGYPWLSTSLQTTADLRDLDAEVLDAVRAAADQAVVWYTDHPDSEYIEVNETCEVERRQQQTGPPGWKPMQMKPEQPGVNHSEYRSDRMREIGRPIGMPLMMIRLGSEEHNFSSARFDNEIYKRGIRAVRKWLQRRTVDSLVHEVRREGELYAAANPSWEYAALARKPKGGVRYHFTWQPMVAVDAEKDAQDQMLRMEAGTLTFEEACEQQNRDPIVVIKSHALTMKRFSDAKVPLPAWAATWVGQSVESGKSVKDPATAGKATRARPLRLSRRTHASQLS